MNYFYNTVAILAGIAAAGVCYVLIGWQIILVVLAFWLGVKFGYYIGDDE